MSTFLDNWLLRRAMSAPRGSKEYIQFADPAVEAICVANWSSDGIGLTMEDAAAVTSQQFGTTFRGNTQITSFDELQYFTGLGTLPANALRDCSALTSVVLPDNLSTIETQAFLNDAALSGTIIIPSSVQNCGVNIFASCVSIVNFYVLSTQNIGLDKWTNYNEFGAGSGVFYSKGSASQPGSEYALAFRDICIEGSVENTTSSRTIFHSGNSIVTIRVGGDVTINANGFVRSNAIKFIEVGGNIISPGNKFANNGSGVILHFGKTDGLACAPSALDDTASSFNSRYDKIYVGSGESQAADQAVLNQYLADPDWAQYSSKLDLWYNYNGQYKNWPTIPTA